MYNMSSAMAGEFVSATEDMTKRISEIGPNPLRQMENMKKEE
jgi:hypothetical protein